MGGGLLLFQRVTVDGMKGRALGAVDLGGIGAEIVDEGEDDPIRRDADIPKRAERRRRGEKGGRRRNPERVEHARDFDGGDGMRAAEPPEVPFIPRARAEPDQRPMVRIGECAPDDVCKRARVQCRGDVSSWHALPFGLGAPFR